MSCRLTMTLISELQEGNVGEDWKYQLDVEVVLKDGVVGQGSIEVSKHNLPSGVVREPYGTPAPQVLFSGDCAGELLLRSHLTATEVDVFVNDVGKIQKDLVMECPGPAGGTVTKEVDIAVAVRESPPILPRKAVFTLRVRFNLTCS
jgi:hypothetical protein